MVLQQYRNTVVLITEDRTIIIKVNRLAFEAKIDFSELSDLLWENLPIEASVNLLGDEIYFKTNLESQSDELRQVVDIGDVAFWPPGQAVCLFFGPTPMSSNDEIRPASGVTVFGKLIDDPKLLKIVKSGESITILKG